MEKLKRYVIFLFGLFISSFGVGLVTKANLGTSPISAIPYVLSLNFTLTLGEFTIIFSIFLIILQLIILRKNFKMEHVLQIPVSILFGYFIDFGMLVLGFVNPQAYPAKIVYLLLGCVVLAFGVYLEVLANVVMLPGESFVRAVVATWDTEFGITKVCFDVSMTVIACVTSLIFAHRIEGVREGTLIAALIVGFIARFFGRILSFFPAMLFPEKESEVHQEDTASEKEKQNICIVIGRQYGSGGHEIGKKLAEKLGFQFYDREIIQMTAGSTGYTPQYISQNEENMTNSFLYDLVNQVYAYSTEKDAPKDHIFETESEVIRNLAQKGNCVIVGRCADYVLREQPNCLRIFLHAPISYRVKRVMQSENLEEKEARAKIHQSDKARADNYRYYTHQIWGLASNYQLTLDTSFGLSYVENMIEQVISNWKDR